MSSQPIDVERLLTRADPCPPATSRSPLDERARTDLAAILSGAAAPRTAGSTGAAGTPARAGVPRSRARAVARRTGLAGAAVTTAVAVLAVGVVDLPGSGAGSQAPSGAHAATPPLLDYRPLAAGTASDAATVLTEIAARTAALPDDTGAGRYAMVDVEGWYLWAEAHEDDTYTSTVVDEDTTTWVADDGSGRVLTRTTQPGEQEQVRDERAAAGDLDGTWPLRSLSADQATLTAQLDGLFPGDTDPTEPLRAVAVAHREMPVDPPVRAAMLRHLAAVPGLQLDGGVTDRLGRPGIAVSIGYDDPLPSRLTLIVDPVTGRLLGEELVLTTDSGTLDIPVPAVISYTAYRDARYTTGTA